MSAYLSDLAATGWNNLMNDILSMGPGGGGGSPGTASRIFVAYDVVTNVIEFVEDPNAEDFMQAELELF